MMKPLSAFINEKQDPSKEEGKCLRGQMLRRLRMGIAAVAIGLTSVVVASGPAQAAAPPGCYADFVCIYQNVNFNHNDPESAQWLSYHVSRFYNCKIVAPGDFYGWTSFYNNTKFKFELWNVSGAGSISKAGTMAPYKGYGYLNDQFNDRVDTIVSPGCSPQGT